MLTEQSGERFIERSVETILQDLQWVIRSPVLISGKRHKVLHGWLSDDFCQRAWKRCEPELVRLCSIDDLCGYAGEFPKTKRLGEYFEWLVALWLGIDPRFELVLRNQPIRIHGDQGVQTLGELDFVIQDLEQHKTIHLEVAVKFYLGVELGQESAYWFGPMQRDRLDIKYGSMQWKQMRMSNDERCIHTLAQQSITVDESWGLIKGRLYSNDQHSCPMSAMTSAEHLKGHWLSWSDHANSGYTAYRFNKSDWMALHLPADALRYEHLQYGPQHCWIEEREKPYFIVPDDWLKRAEELIKEGREKLDTPYREAIYEVQWSNGKRQYRVGQCNAEECVEFYIITAYNPEGARPGEEENQRRNQLLEEAIKEQGYSYWPALGSSEDGEHKEPSFAITGIKLAEIKALASLFSQNALLYWDGKTADLMWV